MNRMIVCLLLLLAGCAESRWEAAHEACQGNAECQGRVEAKQAAVFPAPDTTVASRDPMILPVVPLPRQPNTCVGRTDDQFPTTRCY
jgi:hypothetical protein